MLGNASVFNALLYKGSFPEKNIPGSRRAFYEERYERLFKVGPARENYFLQLSFLGTLLYPEGNPVECLPEVYAAAKSALQSTQVEFALGDAVAIASRQERRIDFLSFSDVPSYFKGEMEKHFMQRIRPGLSADAQVVVRNYLHVPENCDRSGFEDVSRQFSHEILNEKVGVYDVEIFRHKKESISP
jgi:S-adenosylmethionine-diacylglycerol 3-amino-3-carboxypropyl transferase